MGLSSVVAVAAKNRNRMPILLPARSEKRRSMSTCNSSQIESWESEISESVAFLVSAYASIRRLRTLGLGDQPAGVFVELASQNIWTALVALDEYGVTVFEGTRAGGTSPERGGRQERLLTLYSELGLSEERS
jgi:hypothetical protein